MNLRTLLSGLLAIVLSVILAPRSQADGLDQTLLNISLREDPVYPVPEIGQRRFFCRYEAQPGWQEPRMILRIAEQAVSLDNTSAGAPGVMEIHPLVIKQRTVSGAIREAAWTMPWRKRSPGASNLDGWIELLPDGSSGFYQWVVEYETAGITNRLFGDVHSYTMPRRLVFAIMGDSFGSGEGAPAIGSKPWINVAGHRSAVSGGEIAISMFRENYPNLAFDYVNTTSSGAIADDIKSAVGQSKREGTDGQGISTPQAKVLEDFLGKPEQNYNRNSYKHVDAIIMSCGGNDIGFSTIVKHYFGIPTDLLSTAVVCVALLFVPYVGPFLAAACIGIALEADYSFEEQGHSAPYVTPEGYISTPDILFQRLKNEYRGLNHRLVATGPGGLRAGADPQNKTSVDVNKVLVIEYPNPLKKCTSHWDVERILGFTLLPLPLHIAEDEAKEVNTKLAVQTLNTPAPSFNGRPGGLNHTLLDAVAQNNSEFGNWQFVQTGHLMSNNGGLCRSGRQFARRWEAYDMAGPNPENNAIHPNRKGHSEIYAPAISAALQNAVSPAYRQSQAAEEGIKPGSTLLPDLEILWLPMTNLNTTTGQISLNALIRNAGGSASDPGKLEIYMEAVDGFSFSAKLGEVSVPAVPPDSFAQTLTFTLTVPDLLAFRPLPIGCYTSGSNFNPANYETRDRALSYWFIQNSRLRAEVSTPSTESNSQNNSRYAVDASNIGIQSWKVFPAVDPAQLNMVLQDFATYRGLPSATPADIRLTNNIDLSFFGFWNPFEKYSEEHGNAMSIIDLIPESGGPVVNPFSKYRDQNYRNFCTGDKDELQPLIPYLEGADNDGNGRRQPNNDGSSFPVVIQYPGIGGQVIDKTFDIKTPNTAVGIPNYPPGEPITGQRISFNLNVPAKVASYRVMAGLSVGRSDFHDSGMVIATGLEGTTPPPAVASLQGFPADGRTWFVTVESLLQDGKKQLNVYQYESQPLNARLLSPDEGVLPEGITPVLRWQPGSAAAEAYRVRIGSTPGGWDIYGVDPLAPGTGGTGVLSSRTTELGMPTLPRDGREMFITLETKRGGVWHAESYRTQTPMSEEPGLLYPRPGSRLGGRAVIRLNPGDPETRELLLFAGSSPGASDLYRGVSKDPSIDDLVWDFPLPAPETGLPFIYVTVQSDRDPLRRTQWIFPRSMNSTLLTPSPDPFTPLPLGEVEFTWQRGNNVAGHMLTVGTSPGGNDIAEHLADADGRSTAVRIPSSAVGRLLFISLHSIRLDGANGLEEYVIPVTSKNPLYENDGIDDFMQALFFGPNNPQGTADADFNGNGDSNLIDMLAGIDPRALGARWDRKAEIKPDGRLLFQMPVTRPGTLYQIERSGNLTDWEDHGAPIEVETTTPDGVIESQRRTGLVQEFYRLKLEPKE
jgi:hypothetical protein